jgi:hypothetical protein
MRPLVERHRRAGVGIVAKICRSSRRAVGMAPRSTRRGKQSKLKCIADDLLTHSTIESGTRPDFHPAVERVRRTDRRTFRRAAQPKSTQILAIGRG